jgi:hypothetical protein
MTIETDEMEIDSEVPDSRRCGQCNEMAVIAHTMLYMGKTRILGYLCQGCLDTMKRDAYEERYGDGFDR